MSIVWLDDGDREWGPTLDREIGKRSEYMMRVYPCTGTNMKRRWKDALPQVRINQWLR